jgi:hypothetical protein
VSIASNERNTLLEKSSKTNSSGKHKSNPILGLSPEMAPQAGIPKLVYCYSRRSPHYSRTSCTPPYNPSSNCSPHNAQFSNFVPNSSTPYSCSSNTSSEFLSLNSSPSTSQSSLGFGHTSSIKSSDNLNCCASPYIPPSSYSALLPSGPRSVSPCQSASPANTPSPACHMINSNLIRSTIYPDYQNANMIPPSYPLYGTISTPYVYSPHIGASFPPSVSGQYTLPPYTPFPPPPPFVMTANPYLPTEYISSKYPPSGLLPFPPVGYHPIPFLSGNSKLPPNFPYPFPIQSSVTSTSSKSHISKLSSKTHHVSSSESSGSSSESNSRSRSSSSASHSSSSSSSRHSHKHHHSHSSSSMDCLENDKSSLTHHQHIRHNHHHQHKHSHHYRCRRCYLNHNRHHTEHLKNNI